jgi:hypothetical protein
VLSEMSVEHHQMPNQAADKSEGQTGWYEAGWWLV